VTGVKPVEREAILRVVDQATVFDAVSDSLKAFKVRQVSDTADGLTWEVGSRWSFRIWGLWGWNVDKRLPFRIYARVESAANGGGTQLRLESSEGPYLTRLAAVDRAYAQLFDSLVGAINARLG
jgi:hypothetical protein